MGGEEGAMVVMGTRPVQLKTEHGKEEGERKDEAELDSHKGHGDATHVFAGNRPLRQHQYDQRIHRQIGHHKTEDCQAGDSVCIGQSHQEAVHLAQEDGKVGRIGGNLSDSQVAHHAEGDAQRAEQHQHIAETN
ncbi:hypothetical protein TYRP_003110 [Tyrophagus putrescentiae]|nr:hypothetical protein TYRP_003110 [Tyrophagus putrescentiae]